MDRKMMKMIRLLNLKLNQILAKYSKVSMFSLFFIFEDL